MIQYIGSCNWLPKLEKAYSSYMAYTVVEHVVNAPA